MQETIEAIPFTKLVIPPAAPAGNNLYLGMGMLGSDGEPGELGFAVVLFLWYAEKVRQALATPLGTILIMDNQAGGEKRRRVVHRLLSLIGCENHWQIIRHSERYNGEHTNLSYEEMETAITLDLLQGGGYQVGWVYPTEMVGGRDERHFARHLATHTDRRDIGFAFGDFPVLIPGGVPGPPYLVKKRQAEHRLLLVETEETIQKKFARGRIKASSVKRTLEILIALGVAARTDRHVIQDTIDGILNLANIIRET